MAYLFVYYPKCSTCQKAKKWLDASGISYTERDIVQQNPTAQELAAWHQTSGLPLKRFFNTSGMLYRSMALAQKLDKMDKPKQLELLASNGMLVKRPLLIGDKTILVGFREKEWQQLL